MPLASSRCEMGEARVELDVAREGRSTSESDGVEDAGDAANRLLLDAPDACPEEDEVAIRASGT